MATRLGNAARLAWAVVTLVPTGCARFGSDDAVSSTPDGGGPRPEDGDRAADGGFLRPARLVVIGGSTTPEDLGRMCIDAVYSAPIGDDGQLGALRPEPSLPVPRCGARAVATRDWVAVLGGTTTSREPVGEVLVARVGPDGELGAWTVSGALAVPRGYAGLGTRGDVAILAGGGLATNQRQASAVTVVTLAANGPVLADIAPLPSSVSAPAVAVGDERFWVLGGTTEGVDTNAVAVGTKGSGTWSLSSSASPAIAKAGATATAQGGHVVLVGGRFEGLTATPDVHAFPLASDGMLGAPTTMTPVPRAVARHGMARLGERVFVVGGERPGTGADVGTQGTVVCSSDVFVGSLEAAGTGMSWASAGIALPAAVTDPAVAILPPR